MRKKFIRKSDLKRSDNKKITLFDGWHDGYPFSAYLDKQKLTLVYTNYDHEFGEYLYDYDEDFTYLNEFIYDFIERYKDQLPVEENYLFYVMEACAYFLITNEIDIYDKQVIAEDEFLDAFLRYLSENPEKRKEFNDKLNNLLLNCNSK